MFKIPFHFLLLLCIHNLLLFTQQHAFTVALVPNNKPMMVVRRNHYQRRPPSLLSLRSASDPIIPNDDDDTKATKERNTLLQHDDDPTTTTTTAPAARRRVARVEQFARLPVWPAWNGVLIFFVSRIFGNEWAAKLEDAIGGRVCPNFFSQDAADGTDPFIMLVHHRHSFFKWDPLRRFQSSFILPEGFPAHPLRGFTTVTYFMRGGFRHRDSMGIQQRYGALQDGYRHHTQWLFTGAGLLHEEMFDIPDDGLFCDQELYQLWLNIPSFNKLNDPRVVLLGPNEAPRVTDGANTSETVVISGNYKNHPARAAIQQQPTTQTPDIFHVNIKKAGGRWSHTLTSKQETVILYMRRGSIKIDGTIIPVHHTAYLERGGGNVLEAEVLDDCEEADFFLLAGEPLREPVAAQGSMVMNSGDQINQAYADYQMGNMGKPWDHNLSNDEWKDHVERFPCVYSTNKNNYGHDET